MLNLRNGAKLCSQPFSITTKYVYNFFNLIKKQIQHPGNKVLRQKVNWALHTHDAHTLPGVNAVIGLHIFKYGHPCHTGCDWGVSFKSWMNLLVRVKIPSFWLTHRCVNWLCQFLISISAKSSLKFIGNDQNQIRDVELIIFGPWFDIPAFVQNCWTNMASEMFLLCSLLQFKINKKIKPKTVLMCMTSILHDPGQFFVLSSLRAFLFRWFPSVSGAAAMRNLNSLSIKCWYLKFHSFSESYIQKLQNLLDIFK